MNQLNSLESRQSSTKDLSELRYLDTFDLDPRPTLVFDLEDLRNESSAVQPVLCNAALKDRPNLFAATVIEIGNVSTANTNFPEFCRWLRSLPKHPQRDGTSIFPAKFCDLRWLSFTLRGKWKIVSAIQPVGSKTNSASTTTDPQKTTTFSTQIARQQPPYHSSQQPLLTNPHERLGYNESIGIPVDLDFQNGHHGASRLVGSSAFINLVRRLDWASTLLGPISTWPTQLVEMVNLIFASEHAMVVLWGPELALIYNEAAVPTIADRHPLAMGSRVEHMYAEIWESHYKPILMGVWESGETSTQPDAGVFLHVNGFLEERFFTTTFIPLFAVGHLVGVLEILSDVTKQNFVQRRIQSLFNLQASAASADNWASMWLLLADGLRASDRDVPQLLVYSVRQEGGGRKPLEAKLSAYWCFLEATVGYKPSGNPAEMEKFSLGADDMPLAQQFRNALAASRPLRIRRRDTELPSNFWEALEPRGFGDPAQDVVVVPVRIKDRTEAVAFLVIGLNSRAEYNEDYRDFIQLLQGQVSSSITSMSLLEEAVSRSRLEEAQAHEMRFAQFTDRAPIGIATYGVDGSLVYANQCWYSMTGFPRDGSTKGSSWWSNLIYPDDLLLVDEMFKRVFIEKAPAAFGMRLIPIRNPPAASSQDSYIWVICSAYPDTFKQGPDKIVACFTDITEQKRVEELQARRLEDAIEAKRQQENFIDVTSHEIRNPLSVVLQCGEEIIGVCTETLQKSAPGTNTVIPLDLLRNVLEAAETIEYCTLHQRRIVDDILTLSKMDSGLLPVTPSKTQPLMIAQGILKVFNRDLRISEIEWNFEVDESFYNCHVDWAELDSNRFSQVVINLVSNAVKFTKSQSRRRINIKIAACKSEEDSIGMWSLHYLERQENSKYNSPKFDWPQSETCNLHFAVEDTGRGMNEDEKAVLFTRFSQASPYTHVKYGGSGLGLYISRALSEMHGGRIGFTSKAGEGSTFGFFVKVRPCPALSLDTKVSTLNGKAKDSKTLTSLSASPISGELRETIIPFSEISPAARHTIMVVEDNVVNQKVLRRQLEKFGHEIILANHGEEAIDILSTTSCWKGNEKGIKLSAILMDIEMPVMNGLECARKIRELESKGRITVHIPIIAVTGNARAEKVQLAKDAGMDEIVLKPFSIPSLLPLIEQLRQKHEVP